MFVDKKFKTFEFKVGFILFLFIVFFIFLLVYIGIKKDIFAKRITYYVISKSGENIERGIPVKLSGFKIGQVEKLYLNEVNFIKIKISVLEKYKKWFRKNTKIILDQEGIIGNPYLKVIPGTQDSPVLAPGSTLVLTKIGGIRELIAQAQPVIEDMKKIVSNVRKITDQFLDKNASFQKTIKNIEQITYELQTSRGLIYYLTQDKRPVRKIDRLLVHTDNLVTTIDVLLQNATGVVQNITPIEQEALGVMKETKSFVQDLKQLKQKLDPILDNVEDITREVKKATKDIYRLKIEAEYSLNLSSRLLNSLQTKWPFKQTDEIIKNIDLPQP
ncbi:MAG: MlaD family protein [Desulfonauticus sp.]|nr:MlaD family protein [Desulfonauticus sp.]